MAHRLLLCVLPASILFPAAPCRADASTGRALRVRSDFPGGSGEVVRIDQAERLVRIRPARHPGKGWTCWWYVELAGIEPGQTVTVEVEGGVWAWPERASFSLDNRTWQHTAKARRLPGPDGKKTVALAYCQKVAADRAWFAWGPPYLPEHARALIARAERACPGAKGFELCRTREGRPVPALRVRPPVPKGAAGRGVWVQARQHAWESGSSWVCEGFAEWLVSDDPAAAALRAAAEVHVVPIMDVDNVVRGAGGKGQEPRDHNRDWCAEPHWPSVAAATARIRKLAAARRFDVFVDLHNPGAGDREPFFYVPPADEMAPTQRDNLKQFLTDVRAAMTGPFAFRGLTRVSGRNYDKNYKRISKNWVTDHTGAHVVAVTLETAWNTPHSTPSHYCRVGRDLGRGIARFLLRTTP